MSERTIGDVLADICASGIAPEHMPLILELAAIATANPARKSAKSETNARYYQRQKAKRVSESGLNRSESDLNSVSESGLNRSELRSDSDRKGRTIGGDLLSLFDAEEDSKTQTQRVREKTSREAKPKTSRPTLSGHQADFDRWYAGYPRKAAKGAAERAFLTAIKLVDIEKLVAATTGYAAQVAGTEMKFVAHPATWLNGKYWENQQTAVGPSRRAILSNIQ